MSALVGFDMVGLQLNPTTASIRWVTAQVLAFLRMVSASFCMVRGPQFELASPAMETHLEFLKEIHLT